MEREKKVGELPSETEEQAKDQTENEKFIEINFNKPICKNKNMRLGENRLEKPKDEIKFFSKKIERKFQVFDFARQCKYHP